MLEGGTAPPIGFLSAAEVPPAQRGGRARHAADTAPQFPADVHTLSLSYLHATLYNARLVPSCAS